MPESSRHNRGGIDNPSPLDAEFRHSPELLIVKVVNDCLEYAREIDCDEVQFENNYLEVKIRHIFTGMCIEETSFPGFYHDLLREALAEVAALDRGDAGTGETWGLGVLANERSFRTTVDEVGEMDIRVTFSIINAE